MIKLRILAATDFHGSPNADSNLLRFLQRGYDYVILIGDLTNFGPVSLVESMLARLEATGVPILAVPGNCDPKPILEVLEKHQVNLHAKCMKIGGLTLVGFGGSNLTPFNTPFEFTETEIKEELTALTLGVDDNWILITHTPPYDTRVDRTEAGIHVGSKSVRQIIEQKQPLAALCGHVHEARNTDKIGRTLIVNPGPISRGYAAELVVENGVCAKLLET